MRRRYIRFPDTQYIEALEKAATLSNAFVLRKPLRRFLRQPYQLRMHALAPHLFSLDEKLSAVLQESDRRVAFYDLAKLYASARAEERREIRRAWDYHKDWLIPDQTTLACQLPNEKSSEERIWASLIYYSIQDFREDFRDAWLALPPIYHSALQVGLDGDALLRKAAALSGTMAAQYMMKFIQLEATEKSIEACKLMEVKTPEGMRIEHSLW